MLNVTSEFMVNYFLSNNIEVYYSSQEHMGCRISNNTILLGNRLLMESHDLNLPKGKFKKGDLIYFSLGTVCNANIAIFEEVIESLMGLPYRVIVSTGGNMLAYNQLSAKYSNTNIEIKYFAKQLEVLSEAKLFITHAGANGIYEGLYLGVPFVCIPQNFDQPMNAKRIEELGGGITINTYDNITLELITFIEDFKMNSLFYINNVEKIRQSFLSSNAPYGAVQELIERIETRTDGVCIAHMKEPLPIVYDDYDDMLKFLGLIEEITEKERIDNVQLSGKQLLLTSNVFEKID